MKVDQIHQLYQDFLKEVKDELDKQKTFHPDFITEDDVLNEVTTIFENCIGAEFSKKELLAIYEEGKERYGAKIPPGYKDGPEKKEQGDRHVFGDLIIWKELLNYTKAKKKPLIFVTDDRKEDWWTIQSRKTIRPREELIKEFFDITGIRILIYNADQFLLFAKERKFVPKVKDQTISEIREIRISDESYNANFQNFWNTQNLYLGSQFGVRHDADGRFILESPITYFNGVPMIYSRGLNANQFVFTTEPQGGFIPFVNQNVPEEKDEEEEEDEKGTVAVKPKSNIPESKEVKKEREMPEPKKEK